MIVVEFPGTIVSAKKLMNYILIKLQSCKVGVQLMMGHIFLKPMMNYMVPMTGTSTLMIPPKLVRNIGRGSNVGLQKELIPA